MTVSPGASEPRVPLNAFLLRQAVPPTRAFGADSLNQLSWYLWEGEQLKPIDVDDSLLDAAAPDDVVVAILDRPSAPPVWHRMMRDVFGATGFGASGRALGAAIFCNVAEPHTGQLRWVMYSFGSASHAVRRRAVDPRFGLIVALNLIARAQENDPDPRQRGLLRQASYRALGAYSYQAGYRAARDTPLDSFRIDRLADLLSAAGGRVGTDEDPSQVFGSRALKTREVVSAVDDLVTLAKISMADFFGDDYKEDFGFVDHIVPIDEPAVELELRQLLYELLVESSQAVDVLLPDDLVPFEDERSIYYIVRPNERIIQAYDRVLTVDMIAAMIRGGGLNSLDQELRFADSERHLIATASILDCLAADLSVNGKRFVVYDGDLYAVDADLLDRIDEEVRRIPISTGLPCYQGETENSWVNSVAQADPERYLPLDGKLIKLPGESAFEACDLLDTTGCMIHAKRKSRSSAMSHLFVQAERSCHLLTEVLEARDKLKEYVTGAATAATVAPDPGLSVVEGLAVPTHGTKLTLALLGDWRNRSLANLPLLAKMSLVASISALRRRGYVPAVAMVPLCIRNG